MLRIWLLGEVHLKVDDRSSVAPRSAPARWLLAYLALNPGRTIQKSEATAKIWGHGGEDSMRKALSSLRSDLREAGAEDPDAVLEVVGGDRAREGTLKLVAGDDALRVDALEFLEQREDRPADAVTRYRGELLSGERQLPEWLRAQRARFRELASEVHARLAEEEWRQGRRPQAILYAERRVQLDQADARATRDLATYLAQDGRPDEAADAARRFLRDQGPDVPGRKAIEELLGKLERGELDGERSSSGRPKGRSHRTLIGAGVAIAVLLVAILVLSLGGDEPAEVVADEVSCDGAALTEATVADREAIEQPVRGEGARPRALPDIVARSRPRAMAVSSEGVWLAQSTDASIWLIDPRLREPVGQPFPVRGTPFTLAVGGEVLWVTRDDGVLVALDRKTGAIRESVKYGPSSAAVTLGAGSVWVNNYDGRFAGGITRIDPCTGELERIPVGEGANTVVFAFDALWVSDSDQKALHRVDPETKEVRTVRLDVGDPQDIGAGDGYIWVAHYGPKRLTRVDPEAMQRVGPPIRIGAGAAGVQVGLGAVWIPNYEGDSVTRVDLETLRSEPNAVRVGNSPTDLAIGFGRLWVPNNDSEPPTVTPIRP